MTAQHTDRGQVVADREIGPPPPARHGSIAQLLIALSPLSMILVVYGLAQWVTTPLAHGRQGGDHNRLGFALHVAGPAELDAAMFGVIPSVWLQQHFVDGAAHWYDAVAAVVYITHVIVIPLVTTLTWFRMKDRFTAWVAAIVTFTLIGATGYVAYPAAPPWLASSHGEIGAVERISLLGWHHLGLAPVAEVTELAQAASNPVAAMPSLHAGAALLTVGFVWPVATRWWRGGLVAYVLLMAAALVYTGEHYVADIAAGWATAGVALLAGSIVRRRGAWRSECVGVRRAKTRARERNL